jgi:hypothetical protein
MIARAGEGWAPPGGSRVRVRLRRPHGLLLARPRQEPVTRCDGEASIPLRSLTSRIQ